MTTDLATLERHAVELEAAAVPNPDRRADAWRDYALALRAMIDRVGGLIDEARVAAADLTDPTPPADVAGARALFERLRLLGAGHPRVQAVRTRATTLGKSLKVGDLALDHPWRTEVLALLEERPPAAASVDELPMCMCGTHRLIVDSYPYTAPDGSTHYVSAPCVPASAPTDDLAACSCGDVQLEPGAVIYDNTGIVHRRTEVGPCHLDDNEVHDTPVGDPEQATP